MSKLIHRQQRAIAAEFKRLAKINNYFQLDKCQYWAYQPSNMTIINDIDQLSAGEMDEYIEQLLAEMPEPVVNNILDEPISEAVKERPLLPRKYRPSPPPRKAKEKKKKAIVEEFDPAPIFKPFRTIQDYQKEILEMFKEASKNGKLVFRKTPWAIGKFLRGWQMNVPQGHPSVQTQKPSSMMCDHRYATKLLRRSLLSRV